MTHVAILTFNPFQENTYVLYDDTKACVIIDPGCFDNSERLRLFNFIKDAGLKPVRLLNTHCHLDHVFGNKFVSEEWNLKLEANEAEVPVLEAADWSANKYGVPMEMSSPKIEQFIKQGDIISFGDTELEALFTPGHSPGSISFLCKAQNFVIAGDVLFHESIGRTDLPGGDYATLIKSIREELLPLADDMLVYPGHGGKTTIGHERNNNPFLNN